MGLRLRLKANVDISGYPAQLRVILQCLKDYGMILADNGSGIFVGGAPDPRWDNDALAQINRLYGSDLEAVDESGLIIDPDSAAARPVASEPPPTATPPPVAGLQYHPLPRPARLLDTRPGFAACQTPGAPLGGGLSRGACGGVTIPPDAQAIAGNATVVASVPDAAGGHVTLWTGGQLKPNASTLNYTPAQIAANAFTVGLGPDGTFDLAASSDTHLIIDITGYYTPPGAGALYYHPLPQPVRLVDTRAGFASCLPSSSPLAAGVARAIVALGPCDGAMVPTGALGRVRKPSSRPLSLGHE